MREFRILLSELAGMDVSLENFSLEGIKDGEFPNYKKAET